MSVAIIYDLEAVRDPDIAYTPKSPDEFLPLAAFQIVSAAWIRLETIERELVSLTLRQEYDERAFLEAFASQWHRFEGEAQLVGWGIRIFDTPLVMLRGMKHGISFPGHYKHPKGTRNRYGGRSLDLCDQLSDYGAARPFGMTLAAQLVGFPGKTDVTGSDVQALWDAGERERVGAYNCEDVVNECAIFAGYKHLVGDWGTELKDAVLGELRALIGTDERLRGLRAS